MDPATAADERDRDAGFYSDLPSEEMAPGQTAAPLREALVQAILFRILRPSGPQDRFRPGRGVLYGEIRRWITSYQTILTSAVRPVHGPDEEDAASSPNSLSRGGGQPRGSVTVPIVPPVWRLPPSELIWGEHHLPENTVPTREELMALYVFLTGQEGSVNSLTTDSLESVVADGSEPGMEESLGQVKDYATISSWARSYVAIAYRDRIPQVVFGLTPARLTLTDGLLPQKTVTRAEVMLLLYHLYGADLSRLDPHNLLLHGPQVQAAEDEKLQDDKSGANTNSLNDKAAARKPDKAPGKDSDPKANPKLSQPYDPFKKAPTSDSTQIKGLDALHRLQNAPSVSPPTDKKPSSSEKSPRGAHAEEVRQILRIDAPE